MTPSELHSRILLHELRTILLDPTREGTQIPEAWKDAIQETPHDQSVYLVLADELDEQGDELGELCRIQVELIGLLPVDWMETKPGNEHPFERESPAKEGTYPTPIGILTGRRWEITSELYDPMAYTWDSKSKEVPRQKLGRTTRMLTDILRYCALNQGKHVLVRFPGDDVEQSKFELRFDRICRELLDQEPAWLATRTAHVPDCQIHFGNPGTIQLIRTHRLYLDHHNTPRGLIHAPENEALERVTRETINAHLVASGVFSPDLPIQTEYNIYEQAWASIQIRDPDITFTDHACQPNYQMHPIQREFHQPSTQLGKTLARNAITNALINHNTPINPPNGN